MACHCKPRFAPRHPSEPGVLMLQGRGHLSALGLTADRQRAKAAPPAPHPDGCPLMSPAPPYSHSSLSRCSAPFTASHSSLRCCTLKPTPPATFSHSSASLPTVRSTKDQAVTSCTYFSQTCWAGLCTAPHLPFAPA